jgi:mannose-6-phosphate isomerase-like protein (cupin superfamily)
VRVAPREEEQMDIVHAVPTESLSEKLSVQRLSDRLGLTQMRANVYTLAEGSMSRHLHREQEELYVVLDGTAMVDVDEERVKLGERDALAVPARAWHRVSNVGVGPMTFLVVAAPPTAGDAELDKG